MERTLYERLGGEMAILAVANKLYEKLLEDPLVAGFFRGLDMERQVHKQIAFLSWAFGAEQRYAFRPLREAHAQLVRERGLNDTHFDRVALHLRHALEELDIAPQLIDETLTLVASTRSQVLGG
jgi:hemoglobin